MKDDASLIIQQGNTPADLIKVAIDKGQDLDKLEKLLALRERWEAGEAKKAFVRAMTEFKAEAPKVIKDKDNKQYNSKYTSLSNLVNTVSPVLSKHGLSASWDIEQNGIIKVSCKITHELGHSEVASASAPADVSGAKNAVQQIKSTITYLKSVTFESICGLASEEANIDDDGLAAGVVLINEKQKSELLDMLVDAGFDTPEKQKPFLTYMKIDKLESIAKSDFGKAKAAIEAKKKQGAK